MEQTTAVNASILLGDDDFSVLSYASISATFANGAPTVIVSAPGLTLSMPTTTARRLVAKLEAGIAKAEGLAAEKAPPATRAPIAETPQRIDPTCLEPR